MPLHLQLASLANLYAALSWTVANLLTRPPEARERVLAEYRVALAGRGCGDADAPRWGVGAVEAEARHLPNLAGGNHLPNLPGLLSAQATERLIDAIDCRMARPI